MQFAMLGKKLTKTSKLYKKNDVALSIAALQSQLSQATGDLGTQLGATSQFAGHAQSTAKAALQHVQATKVESIQM